MRATEQSRQPTKLRLWQLHGIPKTRAQPTNWRTFKSDQGELRIAMKLQTQRTAQVSLEITTYESWSTSKKFPWTHWCSEKGNQATIQLEDDLLASLFAQLSGLNTAKLTGIPYRDAEDRIVTVEYRSDVEITNAKNLQSFESLINQR